MDVSVAGISSGTRKRKVNPTQRKLAKDKRYKLTHIFEEFVRPCNHNGKTYECNKVTLANIKTIRERYYESANKIDQEMRLAYMISVIPIKRRRPVKDTPKTRQFSVVYFLKRPKIRGPVRVCLTFLTATLVISKRRVSHVAKLIYEGKVPKERRGGDRVSKRSESKKDKIREFIGSLKGRESHYNRKKSKRIYVAADLSISKLCNAYNAQCEEYFKASLSMFSRIFRNEYNIGFSSPASDCCALCTRLVYSIRKPKDAQKKAAAMCELRVHKQRAKAFYALGKENPPNSLSFCFDLQQVQPLPRTPINDAFYSHQISYYVSCFVNMKSKNPTFYSWTENQAGRGSQEIGSALLHYLDSLDLEGIKILRLFCDGCGGQNKNKHIVHALYYWLKVKSPPNLSEIRMFFPVRGHSYLPADRVFGWVEKQLRRKPTLLSIEEYADIYREFGEMKVLGKDWEIYNIKTLEKRLKDIVGISEFKRIYIQQVRMAGRHNKRMIKLKCHKNFRYDDLDEIPKGIIKKGQTDKNLELKKVKLRRPFPEKKKKSLKHLLSQQFGDEWETDPDCQWYKEILDYENPEGDNQESDEDANVEEQGCDCLEDDVGVHI